MFKHLIFDLSEVLISGRKGCSHKISEKLGIDETNVNQLLKGKNSLRLIRGEITEDAYIDALISEGRWNISPDWLKEVFRNNFHNEVPGMIDLLRPLSEKYNLVLLSDHAREWIEYIEGHHKFLNVFKRSFYSFDLGMDKTSPETFRGVLTEVNASPEECLFVDDSQANVEVARGVGVTSILFESHQKLLKDFQRLGIPVI